MSTPGNEVALRRDRMQATIEELRRVEGLAGRSAGSWREAAVAAVTGAGDTWERHVVGTEAPEGILAEVLQQEPRLAHLVDTLRAEHGDVRALLDEVGATLPTDEPAQVQRSVQAVADRLARHHELGAELIHSAYAVDLGGSG